MKRIIPILLILLLIFGSSAQAKLVRYIDESGKAHYVNPDFVKVPERYLPQVISQLEPPEDAQQEINSEDPVPSNPELSDSREMPPMADNQQENKLIPNFYIPDLAKSSEQVSKEKMDEDIKNDPYYRTPENSPQHTQPAKTMNQPMVQLFVSKECDDCVRLEQDLVSSQINYKKYDVKYTSMGKRVYENHGKRVPIVRIGSYTFYTTNINEIKTTLEELNQQNSPVR